MSVELSIASDYAVLGVGPYEFYYGYEFGRGSDDTEVWGARFKKNGETVFEVAHESQQRGMEYDLLHCIGLYLEIKESMKK